MVNVYTIISNILLNASPVFLFLSMIHINCALGFCYECPECNKPDKELDYGPNASMIHLVYIHIKEDVQHMV